MTEYWLQKKTIGGWSHVTWYSDLEQAQLNFANASKDLNGYSWRLVECKVVSEKLLEDAVKVEAPEVVVGKSSWGDFKTPAVQDKPKASGWGTPAPSPEKRTSDNPIWNAAPSEPWSTAKEEAAVRHLQGHGNLGKVWLAHNGLKQKKRVASGEVDKYISEGWYRAGPRVKFDV